MIAVWLIVAAGIVCAADGGPAASAPDVSATTNQAREKEAIEDLRANTAVEREIAELRAAAAKELEAKIAAIRSRSDEQLISDIADLLARLAEERAGIVSIDPNVPNSLRVARRVDPNQSTERVLLLLPGGPIILQLSITIDGQPYLAEQEKILDEMISSADANEDGRLAWEEAIASPTFRVGRMSRNQPKLEGDRLTIFLKQHDANGDGHVARAEARLLLAENSGGPGFSVQTFAGRQQSISLLSADGVVLNSDTGGTGRSPFEILLDTDADGILSRRELQASSWRLKLRDKNDDDALEFSELFDQSGRLSVVSRAAQGRATPPPPIVWMLGPLADWEGLWSQLQQRYVRDGRLTADSFPNSRSMLVTLDKNGNALLDRDELTGLNDVKPHLAATANLGNAGEKVDALKVSLDLPDTTASGALDAAGRSFAVDLPGVRVALVADNARENWRQGVEQRAKSSLAQYDIDKNGYIEQSELPEGVRQPLTQQIQSWDANGDGKVYLEELIDFFGRSQRPNWSRVSVGAAAQDHPLFYALDANGDSQLGLRELESASERLLSFDKNDDGRLAADEVPVSVRIAISRAVYVNQLVQSGTAIGRGRVVAAGQVEPTTTSHPVWFTRMDVNRDGDVSRREFLGPLEKFTTFDTNGDRFIDAAEAAAAATPKGT
jgi:Ca2+-binding EF-hand superfamily protein